MRAKCAKLGKGNAMKTHARKRAAAAALALMSAAAAGAADWKAGIWGPARSQLEPLEWYAKEVAAKTAGRMKIELVYDGQAKGSDAVEWIKGGKYDATYICTAYF